MIVAVLATIKRILGGMARLRRRWSDSPGRGKPTTVEPHIEIILGEGRCRIDFPNDGLTTSARVNQLSKRNFRLESIPILTESACFGDIIQAQVLEPDLIRFERVVVPSKWKLHSFILSRCPESEGRVESAIAKAESLGGHVERVF